MTESLHDSNPYSGNPYSGNPPEGYAKAAALRRALDQGVAAWRASPRNVAYVLGPDVLQAALRYLEAGYRLDEAHKALILRSALAHGVGQVTALGHQRYASTVVGALGDGLIAARAPLSLMALWRLQRAETGPDGWQGGLAAELRAQLPRVAVSRRTHVQAALYQLETGLPILEDVFTAEDAATEAIPEANSAASAGAGAEAMDRGAPRRRVNGRAMPWTWVAVLVMLVGAAFLGLRYGVRAAELAELGDELVTVAAGEYGVNEEGIDGEAGGASLFVEGFGIMRREVTNRAYRRCVEARACRTPASPDSAQRDNYFLDSRFGDYPVVNVAWHDATDYCAWRGMRLPTATEWHVAAAVSPLTGRGYRYPWGDRFEAQAANHAQSGYGDTRPVGSFHPTGSSPWGLNDMAGNVAEWTASPAVMGTGEAGENAWLVKGGSYLDSAEHVTSSATQPIAGDRAEVWLGFRCAR